MLLPLLLLPRLRRVDSSRAEPKEECTKTQIRSPSRRSLTAVLASEEVTSSVSQGLRGQTRPRGKETWEPRVIKIQPLWQLLSWLLHGPAQTSIQTQPSLKDSAPSTDKNAEAYRTSILEMSVRKPLSTSLSQQVTPAPLGFRQNAAFHHSSLHQQTGLKLKMLIMMMKISMKLAIWECCRLCRLIVTAITKQKNLIRQKKKEGEMASEPILSLADPSKICH